MTLFHNLDFFSKYFNFFSRIAMTLFSKYLEFILVIFPKILQL